jgi:hypothetical protein
MPSFWQQLQQQAQQHAATFGGFGGGPFGYDEEAALQAAIAASQREQQQTPKLPPPAAPRVVRCLPKIRISAEDLVDPNNRQCPISFEEHKLGDTNVTRLPCAHLFKTKEIMQWLQTTCTCPVCRYELPTDDASYEPGRIQRMAQRKPRFAKYELQRLSTKQLLQLLARKNHSSSTRTSSSSYQPVEKQDLIEYLITSETIELIHAPEPVQYSLQTLRNMSIKQLKQCMNDEAGVFFNATDVVEKEDMVQIFIASGRLDLIPDVSHDNQQEEQQAKQEAPPPPPPQQQQQEQQKEKESSSAQQD